MNSFGNGSRTGLLAVAAAAAALFACAHAEPLPPRAARPGPPSSVSDHPGFAVSNAEGFDVTERKERAPSPVCVRVCPSGHHCVLEAGVERCVAD